MMDVHAGVVRIKSSQCSCGLGRPVCVRYGVRSHRDPALSGPGMRRGKYHRSIRRSMTAGNTIDHDTHERPMLLGAYVCEAKARSRARLGPKSCVQVIVPIFGGRAHTAVSL